jgi:CheY-like chemotaxis protein
MKILLAEDEPDIQLITRLALEDAGCIVVAVSDGQAALESAEGEEFDVVLLDVMMPRLDGFTTSARLHENPRTRSLPVIFLTAKSQEPEVQRGLATGALGYIVKPFDVFSLLSRITELLNSRSV